MALVRFSLFAPSMLLLLVAGSSAAGHEQPVTVNPDKSQCPCTGVHSSPKDIFLCFWGLNPFFLRVFWVRRYTSPLPPVTFTRRLRPSGGVTQKLNSGQVLSAGASRLVYIHLDKAPHLKDGQQRVEHSPQHGRLS